MNILNKICQEKSLPKIYELLHLLPLSVLNHFVDTIRENIDKIPENKQFLSEAVLLFYLNKDKLEFKDEGFDDVNLDTLDFEDNYVYSEYDKKLRDKYMLEDFLDEEDKEYEYEEEDEEEEEIKPKIREMPSIEEMNAENDRALEEEREARERIEHDKEKYEQIRIRELDNWYMLHPDKIDDNLSLEEKYNKMQSEKKKIKDIEDNNIAEQKEIERTKYKPRINENKKQGNPVKLILSKDDIIEKIENLMEHSETIDKYGIVHKKKFDIAPLYKKILLDILNNVSSNDIATKHNIDKTKIHKIIKRVKTFFSRMFQGIDIDVIKKQQNKPKKKTEKIEKTEKPEIKVIKPYQNPEEIVIEEYQEDTEEEDPYKYIFKENTENNFIFEKGKEDVKENKEKKEGKEGKNKKFSLDEFIKNKDEFIKNKTPEKLTEKIDLDLNEILKYTKMCDSVKNNKKCNRKKCNFAHSIEQLKIQECFNKEKCRNVEYKNDGEYINKGSKLCKHLHPYETKQNYVKRIL